MGLNKIQGPAHALSPISPVDLVASDIIAANTGAVISGFLTVTGNTVISGSVTVAGSFNAQQLLETVVDITLASGTTTAVLDYSQGNIFTLTGTQLTGNVTLNVINVPSVPSRMTTLNVLITQGSTGYVPGTININGRAALIKWPGGTIPTPTSTVGKIDIFGYTLYYSSGLIWTAFASASLNY